MPEQSFRSPDYYEREIDQTTQQPAEPVGVPTGLIGTSVKGPAFRPVTVANWTQYKEIFGGLDPKMPAPYAAQEHLTHRQSLTFVRVLGAGANKTVTDVATTQLTGRVKNAGFKLDGTAASHDSRGRHNGVVQFLTARHLLRANEALGMPMFTDNDSFVGGSTVNLVRGVLMLPSTARAMVLDGTESAVGAFTATGPDDTASVGSDGRFKLVISSTLGNAFYVTDGSSGVKILSASLDPSSNDYFAKILNTDPDKFVEAQHYLYADYAVDDELATATTVGVLSGSALTSPQSGDATLPFRKAFGAYDARYSSPTTPFIISQPFGNTEYDLFRFEAIDDGAYANQLYKISIANIRASLDDSNRFGTFTVHVRKFDDTDLNPEIIESFPNCSLNPQSDNYIAKVIGDRRVYFNFDVTEDSEKRLVSEGRFDNKSKYVRVIVSTQVDQKYVPENVLPFGFRGIAVLKTNDSLTDVADGVPRLAGVLDGSSAMSMSGSIVPPVPFRFKVTKGQIPTTAAWQGQPGSTELATTQFYWGIKFERNNDPLNANIIQEQNALVGALAKFSGISKLDVLVSGSGADVLNYNKFTLAKVAFSNKAVSELTGTIADHMKEAAYVRDGKLNASNYTIPSVIGNRLTLAALLTQGTAADFNRFSPYVKFTTMMYGGYDGLNLLDKYSRRLNDRSTSFDAGGGAEASYTSPGFTTNLAGSDINNNGVVSYMTAIDLLTNPMVSRVNVLAIPGIRETYITDYAMKKVREYGLAFYVMDIPSYDSNSNRLFDDSTTRPDVEKTCQSLDSRAVDNNYAATYFPNVFIDDSENKRRVKVPSSVSAVGALAFNDRLAYPWFAPAGYNRAALNNVKNVEVKLGNRDRDRLQDSRINPIASFPKSSPVIFGQKTLQISKSTLDRVNVRRLVIEVKRLITDLASDMMFEQYSAEERSKFTSAATIKLSIIKSQSGVEGFKVIMNETNNTYEDEVAHRVNGKVVIVPTKAIEYIALDFVITQNGTVFSS